MANLYKQARELFGFDEKETDNLIESLEEEGFDYETDSLRDPDWADYVAEVAVDELIDEDDVSGEYLLDPNWEYGEDEWLDAGIEVELTTVYEETAG